MTYVNACFINYKRPPKKVNQRASAARNPTKHVWLQFVETFQRLLGERLKTELDIYWDDMLQHDPGKPYPDELGYRGLENRLSVVSDYASNGRSQKPIIQMNTDGLADQVRDRTPPVGNRYQGSENAMSSLPNRGDPRASVPTSDETAQLCAPDTQRFVQRYANQFYFGGSYDRAALAAVELTRARLDFKRNIVHQIYPGTANQRYLLINDHFGPFLNRQVLDVGSRTNTMREVLHRDAQLIDRHNPALPAFNWEAEALPYPDNAFDTVVCLDTLEHIDDLHAALDDLARVAKRYVIVSLPNCWRKMATQVFLGHGTSASYGLPPEKPHDRHKWFFNTEDIEDFVYYNAARLGLEVVAVRYNMPRTRAWHGVLHRALGLLPDRYLKNLFTKTMFVCLEKHRANSHTLTSITDQTSHSGPVDQSI